jgi:hypothetical protein
MNNVTGSTSKATALHNTTPKIGSGEKAENHCQKEKLLFTELDKGPYSMFLKRDNREQVSGFEAFSGLKETCIG